MATLKSLIEGAYGQRKPQQLLALRRDVCDEIEKLQQEGKCPVELWKAMTEFDSDNKTAVVVIAEAIMQLVDYIDSHEDEIPQSIMDIMNDYKNHIDKNSESVI